MEWLDFWKASGLKLRISFGISGTGYKMKTVRLVRTETGDQGTFGALSVDGLFHCVTGELPWRNNLKDRSCVPSGTYRCTFQWSEKHQRKVYHLLKVPGRDAEEIHSANLMGDVDKGFLSQLLGCIALGEATAVFPAHTLPVQNNDQKGVTSSREDVDKFEKLMGGDDFDLTVEWAAGVGPEDGKEVG